MEIWPLIILLVLGVPLVLAIWLIVRAARAKSQIESLIRRVNALELQVVSLKKSPPPAAAPTGEATPQPFKPATLTPLPTEDSPAAVSPPEVPPVKTETPVATPPNPIAPPPVFPAPPAAKPEWTPPPLLIT